MAQPRPTSGANINWEVTRAMIEPTLTQSSALFFVQHKVSRPRAFVFQFGKARLNKRQAQLRQTLFRWPRIRWGKKG
jgi:hypothetical protein